MLRTASEGGAGDDDDDDEPDAAVSIATSLMEGFTGLIQGFAAVGPECGMCAE